MKAFLDENFLLDNDTAVKLYNDFAKDMPIFDYHCHLNSKEIAENKKFRNITELSLGGDHYKWRAMRANGVEEKFITGDAPDKAKFVKWAETIENCIGNPLYHWTHLELKRYFGIDKLLSIETVDEIWETCNEWLEKEEFTVRGLINSFNVKAICTTDDPTDSLEHHIAIAKDKSFNVKVLPTFRPDKSFNIERVGFVEWIAKLGSIVGKEIKSFNDLTKALKQRIEFFHEVGCRISDHALDTVLFLKGTELEADEILKRALEGKEISEDEIKKYKAQVLLFLGKEYAAHGWVMQLHTGVIRNTSSRMFKILGADVGYDAIGDSQNAIALVSFLNILDESNELPKTILYCLNPNQNEVLATVAGSFQGGGIPGKMQFGSGWWFNDQKDGMIKQMVALANIGLLSRFVGMLTDSRSFLSYPRHEYFRRILCNLLGEWVENGEAPNDMKYLGTMVKNICFNNAKEYFGIEI